MPAKRSARASSVEEGAQAPTRTSRRLRSRQDPNDSPLRALEAPSRRKRMASAEKADTSTLYTQQAEDQLRQEETAAGVSEWQARVVALLNRNLARTAQQHRDLTFTEVTHIVNFENATDYFSSFDLAHDSDVHVALRNCANLMTDQQIIDLAIKQVGQISTLKDKAQHDQRLALEATHERDDVQQQLEIAQDEIRELQEKLEEKERQSALKRPAPSANEVENGEQERSSRRVKLTPSTRKSITPKSTLSSTRLSLSSPLAMAIANRQTPPKTPLMVDEEDDEEDEYSFYATQGRPSPAPATSKYEAFVAQRMRQKERETREAELLGADFTSPKLQGPSELDYEMVSEEEEEIDGTEDDFANTQENAHASNGTEFISNALTPIREESEPATPTVSRWGLSSFLAPVARLFTGTPRTEPARQMPRSHPVGTTAPTTTPSDSHSPLRRASSGTSSSSRPVTISAEEEDEDEPVTPTPNHGITAASFFPQSAPQARSAPQPQRHSDQVPRYRQSHSERIKLYDAGVAKRKKAAEKLRQAEELARQKAIEAEDIRLRTESRALRALAIEKMQNTGEKRKVRVDDLAVIPNPMKGGYGMDDKFFEEDSDGEVYIDEDVSMVDAFTPPPAKKVRFNGPSSTESTPVPNKPWWQADTFNNVSPHIKTPTPPTTSDPHRAQPYTGKMFGDSAKQTKADGGNGSGQSKSGKVEKNLQHSSMSQATSGQKQDSLTAPKTTDVERPSNFNWEGHFAVPDDSDTESEFESSPSGSASTPKTPRQNPTTPKSSSKATEQSAERESRTNIFMKQTEQAKDAAASKDGNETEQSLVPPPPPTPAHAALPGTPAAAPNPNDSDALAKARSQAEKYKPKTPSGLRATSRLSSSPVIPTAGKPVGNNNIFGLAPNAPLQPTTSLFSPLPTSTDDEPNIALVAEPTVGSQTPVESEDVPYEQTIQYAIDLAQAVPLDSLPPSDFVWPTGTPPPWTLDPQIEAALEWASQQPDYEAKCDAAWNQAWTTYLQEEAEGKHNEPIRCSPLPASSPLTI